MNAQDLIQHVATAIRLIDQYRVVPDVPGIVRILATAEPSSLRHYVGSIMDKLNAGKPQELREVLVDLMRRLNDTSGTVDR